MKKLKMKLEAIRSIMTHDRYFVATFTTTGHEVFKDCYTSEALDAFNTAMDGMEGDIALTEANNIIRATTV